MSARNDHVPWLRTEVGADPARRTDPASAMLTSNEAGGLDSPNSAGSRDRCPPLRSWRSTTDQRLAPGAVELLRQKSPPEQYRRRRQDRVEGSSKLYQYRRDAVTQPAG